MSKAKDTMFDLGSEPEGDDFNPFAPDDEEQKPTAETLAKEALKDDSKEPAKTQQDFVDKLPVFEYAGATESIEDTAKTFDELRIEKSADFPELGDDKRVSWTVEYGKAVKTVLDPKGISIGKMKADIEASKEFVEGLKKAKDKNPTCKVKPRITAQSKGTIPSYKGVFTTMDEAQAAAKAISIVPAKDGKVYEIRDTQMGRFITPTTGCEMLSEIKPGFIPALPRIPSDLMMMVLDFFRHYTNHARANEALVNIYWDNDNMEFIADVPKQVVSKESVDSQISEEYAGERYIHYMDIHSHNTMKAFFSKEDDRDETATRLYTVIGKLNEYVPEIKTRISNGGIFLEIDPAEVFEYLGVSFPEKWQGKVHFCNAHKKNKRSAMLRFLMPRKKLIHGVGNNAVCVG